MAWAPLVSAIEVRRDVSVVAVMVVRGCPLAGPNSPAHAGCECSTGEDVSDSAVQNPLLWRRCRCGGAAWVTSPESEHPSCHANPAR